MSDNEKIVAKLQDAAAYFRSSFDAMYGTVACEKFRSWTDAIEQAIALLKAQEPRVMTLEEYKAWTDIPFCERDPIFLEMKSRRGAITWWTNTAECSVENYGKTGRFWTSRPTDEQREKEPWNGQA